ncbi:MAG: hypothetical protein R2911_30845 [Caldilineaceae bacterium]
MPFFKHESILPDILRGRRNLTVAHIDGLATFLGVPHHLFFEPAAKEVDTSAQSGVRVNH